MSMRTVKIIFIIFGLIMMMVALGSCSSYQTCHTYSSFHKSRIHNVNYVMKNNPL